MTNEGPHLEGLLRRLAECPPEFQLAPWLENLGKTGQGTVHVDALVRDWLYDAGMEPLAQHEAARYRTVTIKPKATTELTATTASVPLAGAPTDTGAKSKAKDKAKEKAKDKESDKEKLEQTALAANAPAITSWLRLVSVSIWLLSDQTFLKCKAQRASVLAFLNTELDEVAQVSDAALYVTDGDRREELVRRALRAFSLRPARESRDHANDRLTTLDSVELRRVAIAARQAEERARAIREAMARKAAEEAAATYNRE
ncbi:MAG: hypothetical protein ACAI35_20935 [Candidatus Methylacidiphilales bacterium]|nr:hypothetical protein [Candidatus Methylacidiphilales bacterium]